MILKLKGSQLTSPLKICLLACFVRSF